MERLAGAQLLNCWYSWRIPLNEMLAGMGVGTRLAVGEGNAVSVSTGRGVAVGVGAMAVKVALTIASTCSWGTKTTSSGGLKKRLTCTSRLSTRHPNRSWIGGRLYTTTLKRHRAMIPARESSK